MEMAEPLYILNPIIEQYDKKFILGIDKESKSIFQELCTRRVHIDGFIDEQHAGMFFFHKPVYATKQLKGDKENTILLSMSFHNEPKDYNICTQICILNPKLYGKKIMVYGAGIVGENVFSILQEQGIDVIGFIDSDESKVGTSLLGKMIYGKDVLQTLADDTVIVENGKRYYEIDNIVKSMRNDLMRFYLDDEFPFELNDIWVDKKQWRRVSMRPIAMLGEYYEHEQIKEIILYGNDLPLAKKYAEVLECLDFLPVSFMTDQCNENNEIPVIDEIIYKDNYLLLWYEENDDYVVDRLTGLGVERRYCGKMISGNWYAPNIHAREACLDVNLGYTFETNYEYPGIYIYGENRKSDYKIATLGGSTTDSMLDSNIRSWVEIMYEEYCGNGITIFNGGISGYSSGQELLKLIRDLLKLHPDMVIVFDGFNDIVRRRAPEFQYLEELVNYAGKYMPKSWQLKFGKRAVWRGIPFGNEPIDNFYNWLENIKYMNALCRNSDIEFFSFIQPMLFTKKNLDAHSKTILLQTPLFYDESFMKSVWQFREKASEVEKRYSFMHDLSYIFDDDDVYMDTAHVYELGNQIIAKHIWKEIEDKIRIT